MCNVYIKIAFNPQIKVILKKKKERERDKFRDPEILDPEIQVTHLRVTWTLTLTM